MSEADGQRRERSADAPGGSSANDGSAKPVSAREGAARVEGLRETVIVEQPVLDRAGKVLPERFGRYEILEQIGHGGMGIVYRARDPRLNRIVALKVLLSGEVAPLDMVQRFHTEAQSAAKIRHPNIVAIHEVGVAAGVHYFTMDFVKGQSLADAIAARKLTLRQSLGILETTTRAIHYAHTQGIIHRDLKPDNVLLDEQGEPQITDFGLAKDIKTDFTLTQVGAAMGTPAYMSPEQALGHSKDMDVRSDVYALGAMMYELLTGRPPFTADSHHTLMTQVVQQDPVPPRRLNASIGAEVETICLKCLAKERERRYQTAMELAEDIRRYLDGQPITARPTSLWYRTRKHMVRHKAVAGVTAAAAVLVVALLAGWIVTLNHRTRQAESAAEAERLAKTEARQSADAERAAKEQAKQSAAAERAAKEDAQAEEQKAKKSLAESIANEAAVYAQAGDFAAAVIACFRGREILDTPLLRLIQWNAERGRRHPTLTLKGHDKAVSCVAFSPDGKLLASGAWDGTVRFWDPETGAEKMTLRGHRGAVNSIAFAPDGRSLASGAGLRTESDNTVRLWDVETGKERARLKGHDGPVNSVAFSLADGNRMVTGSDDKTLRLWNLATGEGETLKGHTKAVRGVAFSPDGKRLASGSEDQTVKVWDADTAQEIAVLRGHTASVHAVCFSPDGQLLASGSSDATVRLWDPTAAKEEATLTGHTGTVTSVAFSPDGKCLASAATVTDPTVRLWDAKTRTEMLTLRGHSIKVLAVAFSPDGTRVASGGEDRTIKLWNLQAGKATLAMALATKDSMSSVAFSPDGTLMASGSRGSAVQLWDPQTGRNTLRLTGHKGEVTSVAFSPEGGHLASAGQDTTVRLWDLQKGKEQMAFRGHTAAVQSVAFGRDGKRLASGAFDHTVKLWDADTGKAILTLKGHTHEVHSVAFSPDGKTLASGSLDQTVRLWDLETGDEARVLHSPNAAVNCVAFSPDGTRLVAATRAALIVRVWDTRTWQEMSPLRWEPLDPSFSHYTYFVAFSPDGKRVATGSHDMLIRIWDLESGKGPLVFWGHNGCVYSVAFSPGGNQLVSACNYAPAIRIWDVDPAHGP
ncbi:MAG: hypothetical protein FJ279_17045 [Planctomycetes bacterium]|nr:hypothetical protein [Planctomycetota bacterium]